MGLDLEGKKRRGPYPRRSKEITRQLLIDAVGDILKEKGWKGLGVNKIAISAGVDKKLIYYYFGSYNNLLKTFIKSRDFWVPVFEEFNNGSAFGENELPGFLTSVFQGQFRNFFSDPVMQTIIHWQVSESNPLLREISEERETEAAKIAAMTDPHFSDTEINFRAVLAIVLGGVYNIVWHAKVNGTSVCGIDINTERDREDLIRTIGQIIDLFWKAADKDRAKP